MLEIELKEGTVLELQTDIVGKLPKDENQPESETQSNDMKPDEIEGIFKIKVILLLFGVSSLLPWNVYLNSEGYFRKKVESSHLSDTFALYFQANAIFGNLIGSFVMFYLQKKFDPRKLVLVSTITFAAPLIVVTTLTKINTDSWAEEFFIINLAMYGINAMSHGIMTSCHSILCTMIHPGLLKIYYIGKGLAGLAGSAVALTTLAFPTVDVKSAAFYYFLVTTILTLVGTTVLTVYFLNMGPVKERTIKKMYQEEANTGKTEDAASLLEITKAIKVPCISVLLLTVSSLLVFPATLTNLKSMNPKPGTDWTDKFFLPITVFLVWAIGDNVGKILTEFLNWPSNDSILCILWIALGRLLLIPLTLMTNIQPRTIPVWFKSDVIPSIITFITAFTGGYLVNLTLSYAPGYVQGKENQGKASMVMFFFVATGLAIGSSCIFLIPPLLNI